MFKFRYIVAVVGLEREFYEVPEDVGVVEVCAVVQNSICVDCPISFPFDVILYTSGLSTGIILKHVCILHLCISESW